MWPTKKVLDWRKGFVKELNRSTLKKRLYSKEKATGNMRGCFTLKKRFYLECVFSSKICFTGLFFKEAFILSKMFSVKSCVV